MSKAEKLADELVTLNVTELQELKKVLKDKYGLEETIPIVPTITVEKEEVVVEKTEFDVYLNSIGAGGDKLTAVKVINKFTELGLKPAMDLTKELPSLVKEKVSKSEAEAFKNEMAALNAVVELK